MEYELDGIRRQTVRDPETGLCTLTVTVIKTGEVLETRQWQTAMPVGAPPAPETAPPVIVVPKKQPVKKADSPSFYLF